MAKVVVPIKTEPKCKLCSHPRRTEIDALLLRRSEREKGINLDFVLKQLAEWEVSNPTGENVKVHWQKHCETILAKTAEEVRTAGAAAAAKLSESGEHADIDDTLRSIVTLGRAQLIARIERGENPITIDHMLKATAELTKRDHNQAQHELLDALTQGIGAALATPKAPKQIGDGEVVKEPGQITDAEFEELFEE